MSFCTDAGEKDELLRRLDSLDIRAVDAALASAPRQPTHKQPRGTTVQSTGVTAATERLASLSIAIRIGCGFASRVDMEVFMGRDDRSKVGDSGKNVETTFASIVGCIGFEGKGLVGRTSV